MKSVSHSSPSKELTCDKILILFQDLFCIYVGETFIMFKSTDCYLLQYYYCGCNCQVISNYVMKT